MKSPENSYKPKTTNSEMLLYLSEDIRTSFLVAYTFPQCALDDGMSPENVKSNTYIYRNTFIRMIREDMNIPVQENITKEQNKRFDKYFDEEKRSYVTSQFNKPSRSPQVSHIIMVILTVSSGFVV